MRRANLFYLVAGLLFVATLAFSVANTSAPDQTGLSRSASVSDEGPGGTAVLRRWVEDLGVRTRVIQGDRYVPATDDTRVVLVLGASELITPADVGALREFVSGGGTLVVATEAGFTEGPLLDAFGIRITGFRPLGAYDALGPVMSATGARQITIDQGRELALGERGIPIAGSSRAPIAAMVPEGRGVVYVVGTLAPFLSGQLAEPGNARFALALLDSAVRSGGVVAFDEYHHGAHPPPDLLAVIERTWPGRALVIGGGLVFLYLVLTGRRLGPPVPLEHRPARSSLDHVRAFAGLVRRSGHGEIARERLRRELRQGIAREIGLDPATPSERLMKQFAVVDPARAREAAEIDALLSRPLRDQDLLRSVGRIERVLRTEKAA